MTPAACHSPLPSFAGNGERLLTALEFLKTSRTKIATSLFLQSNSDAQAYRSSSGCTHLYGIISRCSVNLIIRTGGL